jgi:type II secretory pathway pseudopilin PulG
MNRPLHKKAFSLVELVLALGVAGFALIAVMGTLPAGLKTQQAGAQQTSAGNIMAAVIADLRATTTPPAVTTSTQYKVTFGTSKTLYFDSAGQCSSDLAGSTKPDGSAWSPSLQTRYQLTISFPWASRSTYGASMKVTWPAVATQATASGSTEMFVAFDRN